MPLHPTVDAVQNSELCNPVSAGIPYPAEVGRAALQDASPIAGLLITTEAMVSEKPEKKGQPAMPPGAAWVTWTSKKSG